MDNYTWSDVEPIEFEETQDFIAPIQYSDRYKQLSALARATMVSKEFSERTLALTNEILEFNPAHYTIWDYRSDIAAALADQNLFDFKQEAEWLDNFTVNHAKGYQVWNYRQKYISLLDTNNNNTNTDNTVCYERELKLVARIFEDDPKNFHAWTHLTAIVKFSLEQKNEFFTAQNLLSFTTKYISRDVYNNSAWTFRRFVSKCFKEYFDNEKLLSDEVFFVSKCIESFLDNESPWWYLRSILHDYQPNSAVQSLVEVSNVYKDSVYAKETLAECYTSMKDKTKAAEVYQDLSVADPSRKGFWLYKKSQVV